MSDTLQITGSIHKIEELQTFDSGFTKREFIVNIPDDKNSDYDQFVKFELIKDRVNQIDPFKVGDNVEVKFNIRGNEYKGRYFVNLQSWAVNKVGGSAPQAATIVGNDEEESSIPF